MGRSDKDGASETSRSDGDVTVSDSPRTRATEHAPLPPRFTVKQTLGEGGMGMVVEAYDRVLSRDVAIKILARAHQEDPNVGVRFLREARAAAQLRHPGIVQVHDVDPDGGFIVMELVRGESLATRLWREKKLPAEEVRRIGTAIAGALAAAHTAGIVHRDVKPANVLLGEGGVVKLADFGVAYFGDSELTMPGTRVGTPAYMAPEQLRGKDVTASADVYSAGVTLFEAATGERPSDDDEHDPYGVILAATGDTVLAAAIARAIRPRPADRFPDGSALVAALDATAVPASPPTARVNLPVPRPRRWPWVALTAAIVLGGGAAVAVLHFGGAGAPPRTTHRTIALLPFVDQTKNPLLDFAAAGLPNLLGLELHGLPDVTVLGYYKLLDIAGPGASRDTWLGAAKKLGADVVVLGEISGAGKTIHVVIDVDTIDGARLDRVERDAAVEEVPEVVRQAARSLVKIAAGRELASSPGTTSFAADRELQLGIAALEREHLDDAIEHLRAALRQAPDLALAHYYLAAALSWSVPPAEPARLEIQKALATGKLDEAQRGFLAGIARIAELDYVGGIDVLRPLAEKFADDRDILYALFECYFHGGRPAEAMTLYHRINVLAPKFRLALVHVFTFYISHFDEKGMAWALELNEPTGDTYATIWEPRIKLARRDYPGVIQLLSQQIALAKYDAGDLKGELVIAYTLSGQIEVARSLANELSETNVNGAAPMLLGLASARGDDAGRRNWLETVIRTTNAAPLGPSRALPLALLVSSQLAAASEPELAAMSRALEASVVPTYERSLNLQLAQVFLAEALHDHARVDALTHSPQPEVSELAHAAVARRTGDRATAATAMRRSIAATGDARFIVDQWWQLAGDLRATGDHAGVLAACDEVIRPRLFLTWAWGSTVGDCLAWTGEASEALGRVDDARAAWTRLVALRGAAPPNDPLVKAGREALAHLPAP